MNAELEWTEAASLAPCAMATYISPAPTAWRRAGRCSSRAAACRRPGAGRRAVHGGRAGLRDRPEHRRPAGAMARELGRTRRPACRSSLWKPTCSPATRRRERSPSGGRTSQTPPQGLLAAWPDATSRASIGSSWTPTRATLDLYVGEVGDALARWSGPRRRLVPRRLLSGAEPADVERRGVLSAVGRLSAPGARLATFTVAGHVRQGTGRRRVRSREAARLRRQAGAPGRAASHRRGHALLRATSAGVRSVAIVGAGIAGAALVRAFQHGRAIACTLFEAAHPRRRRLRQSRRPGHAPASTPASARRQNCTPRPSPERSELYRRDDRRQL